MNEYFMIVRGGERDRGKEKGFGLRKIGDVEILIFHFKMKVDL